MFFYTLTRGALHLVVRMLPQVIYFPNTLSWAETLLVWAILLDALNKLLVSAAGAKSRPPAAGRNTWPSGPALLPEGTRL